MSASGSGRVDGGSRKPAYKDQRLGAAVDVVRRARRTDGRWPTYAGYPGGTWFQMEEPGPSRWNTVRVLRVLNWWEAAG